MKTQFKRLVCTLIFLLGVLPVFAETDVLIDLKDARLQAAPYYTNRIVWVQAQSVPTANSPSVIMGATIQLLTDSNGQCWISNAQPYLYLITVRAPPVQEQFKILVSSTDMGAINAADNMVASSSATFPAGAVAWSAAVSDSRYSRGSNQPISSAQIVNALGFTPTSYPVSTNIAAYQAQLATNNIPNQTTNISSAVATSVVNALVPTLVSSNAFAAKWATNVPNGGNIGTLHVQATSTDTTLQGLSTGIGFVDSAAIPYISFFGAPVSNRNGGLFQAASFYANGSGDGFVGAFNGIGSGISNLSGANISLGTIPPTAFNSGVTQWVQSLAGTGGSNGISGPYVQSWNSKTGQVVMVSSDVVSALGYIPVGTFQIGTAAYSNSAAFYLNSNPSNFIVFATGTNIAKTVSQQTAIQNNNGNGTNASFWGSSVSLLWDDNAEWMITRSGGSLNIGDSVGGANFNIDQSGNVTANKFIGVFAGDGFAISNLNITVGGATNWTGLAQSNQYNGAFIGNATGLTNFPASLATQTYVNSATGALHTADLSQFQLASINLTNWSGISIFATNGLASSQEVSNKVFISTNLLAQANTNLWQMKAPALSNVVNLASNSYVGTFTGNGVGVTNVAATTAVEAMHATNATSSALYWFSVISTNGLDPTIQFVDTVHGTVNTLFSDGGTNLITGNGITASWIAADLSKATGYRLGLNSVDPTNATPSMSNWVNNAVNAVQNLNGNATNLTVWGSLVLNMTNATTTFSNVVATGVFTGNGAGLTNLFGVGTGSSNITDNAYSAVVRNLVVSTNATFNGGMNVGGSGGSYFTNGITLISGQFVGNGAGLTNLSATGTGSSNITDSAYVAIVRNLSVRTNAYFTNGLVSYGVGGNYLYGDQYFTNAIWLTQTAGGYSNAISSILFSNGDLTASGRVHANNYTFPTNAPTTGNGTVTLDMLAAPVFLITNQPVTISLANIPTSTDRPQFMIISNSASTNVLITLSGFSAITNGGAPTSTFWTTNNDAKRQVTYLNVNSWAGKHTNAIVTHFYNP